MLREYLDDEARTHRFHNLDGQIGRCGRRGRDTEVDFVQGWGDIIEGRTLGRNSSYGDIRDDSRDLYPIRIGHHRDGISDPRYRNHEPDEFVKQISWHSGGRRRFVEDTRLGDVAPARLPVSKTCVPFARDSRLGVAGVGPRLVHDRPGRLGRFGDFRAKAVEFCRAFVGGDPAVEFGCVGECLIDSGFLVDREVAGFLACVFSNRERFVEQCRAFSFQVLHNLRSPRRSSAARRRGVLLIEEVDSG